MVAVIDNLQKSENRANIQNTEQKGEAKKGLRKGMFWVGRQGIYTVSIMKKSKRVLATASTSPTFSPYPFMTKVKPIRGNLAVIMLCIRP